MLIATTRPGAQPQTHEAHDQHDGDGLEQPARELPDGFLDDLGLVGDAMHVDAHRQITLDARELFLERHAEVEHVAALRHGDADADRGRAVEAVLRRRRILVAARDMREIPKPHLPVADANGDVLERRNRIERATHTHGDAFAGRFDGAGGDHGVLAGERRGHQVRIDPQARHLPQAKSM